MLPGFDSNPVDFASRCVQLVGGVPGQGHTEHGPTDGRPRKDGVGSVHYGNSAPAGTYVQVLLLQTALST